MSDIDDVLSESMRRRAAEARLGGGSMADVQQRVVHRRRKLASLTMAALAVPGLLAVGIVVGQHTVKRSGVVSASAAAGNAVGDAATPQSPGQFSTSASCAVMAPVLPQPSAVTPDIGPATAPAGQPGQQFEGCARGPLTVSCVSSGPMPLPQQDVPTTTIETPQTTPLAPFCSAPDCSGTVTVDSGSGQVVPANPTGIAGGIYPQSFPLETYPPTVIAGSIPPGVPTPPDTVVMGYGGCGGGVVSGPTIWRCQGEVPSSTAADGWHEYTRCEPQFSGGPTPTTVEVTGTTNPVNDPTYTTVEANIVPTSTIPVDPPVTTNP
jgi:hypothetical protein